jgi:hypothetical protein
MRRKNFPRRRETRRIEAEERQEERNKRSNAQQLARLDKKLGEGKGAVKERLKLLTST